MHVQRVLSEVVGARRNGQGWIALCPCHADQKPSLGITFGQDDRSRVNLRCFAGCDSDDILRALVLCVADLYPDGTRKGVKIERRHSYHDQFGTVLFEVRKTRFGFRYFHPSPDGPWVSGRGDAAPVLYRLPDLLDSHPDLPVWVCEGERDADTMAGFDHISTTVPSRSWNLATAPLAGRTVYIVCDNDRAGWKHAQAAREAVEAAGARFDGVFRPPDEFKDVTELVQHGYCPDDRLIEVHLETERPPFENWHRRYESPVDRRAYTKEGDAVGVRLPVGVLSTTSKRGGWRRTTSRRTACSKTERGKARSPSSLQPTSPTFSAGSNHAKRAPRSSGWKPSG